MSAETQQQVAAEIETVMDIETRDTPRTAGNNVTAPGQHDGGTVIMFDQPAGYNAHHAFVPMWLKYNCAFFIL